MSVYTRTGDNGTTSLLHGKRLGKDQKIFEVLGTLDEFNSVLGLVLSSVSFSSDARKFLVKIQGDLFNIGAKIADDKSKKADYIWLNAKTSTIEELIDELESTLPKLTNFILPGGSVAAAHTHVARSLCRRLERTIVSYDNSELEYVLVFINRLSDLLFVLARHLNQINNVEDVIWTSKND